MDLCISGKTQPSDVDDYVSRWHDGHSNKPLHEFLGMTIEEYCIWVKFNDVISDLVRLRKIGVNFGEHPITSFTIDYLRSHGYSPRLIQFAQSHALSDSDEATFVEIRKKWYKHTSVFDQNVRLEDLRGIINA